jgi:hypothetical protein
MIRRLLHNELERLKKAVMAEFKILSRHLPGGAEGKA